MLLYIRGEGGVSKSQVIKVIVASMDLIYCKDEVILIVPTRDATDNISENTYYTSLGINCNQTQKSSMSSHINKLRSREMIIIINEISMIDLSMLNKINN